MITACAALAAMPLAAQTRGNRYMINRTDIEQAGHAIVTADDAVRRLRPQWFEGPMVASAGARTASRFSGDQVPVVLYIDGKRQPGLEPLRGVPASDVEEMRFVDHTRAAQQLGAGHESGAIMVKRRKSS